MGTLLSPQLSARPFRLDTSLDPRDLVDVLTRDLFQMAGQDAPTGWGSPGDSVDYLDLPPSPQMTVSSPDIIQSSNNYPLRLRARFYWTRTETRARRQNDEVDDWRVTHILQAADVLLYQEPDGGYSGLVTTRTPRDFNRIIEALKTSVVSEDSSAAISTEIIPERLSGDFFLWLFYREQTSKNLGASGLELIEVTALSSLNRNKGAHFRDGATLERIELVSLIATSQGQFGPAKFSINSEHPDASFDLDLHPDGGFRPLRTSDYETDQIHRDDQGVRMFDDLWTNILPELRSQYAADEDWFSEGRENLKAMCMDAVKSALETALSITAADSPKTLAHQD